MNIEFYCPRWGSEDMQWEPFCSKVKDAGYNGIEYSVSRNVTEKELDEVWNVITKYGLKAMISL